VDSTYQKGPQTPTVVVLIVGWWIIDERKGQVEFTRGRRLSGVDVESLSMFQQPADSLRTNGCHDHTIRYSC